MKTKKLFCIFLSALFAFIFTLSIAAQSLEPNEISATNAPEKQNYALNMPALAINAEGAVLMEADTGTILYAKDADIPHPPASVTKVMSLLLIMEALDEGRIALSDMISVSDYASSMGGSQVYLETGEQMTLEEMLKAIIIASGNDATVAVAEHLMGSVEAFVARMNERAAELGMKNTNFVNTTGLDAEGHETSALDIAVMSRELIKHKKIFDYTKIWMDTIRNGEFGLANTNKLIRFYNGATGLKTGSTGIAKYCLSATAERGGMSLIAVVMAAPTSEERFSGAKKMLDYGFATYAVYKTPEEAIDPVRVTGGIMPKLNCVSTTESILINKGKEKNIEKKIELSESVAAPVKKGQVIGSIKYTIDGKTIAVSDITAAEDIGRISTFGIFRKMIGKYFMFD